MSALPFDRALLYIVVVECKMDGSKLLFAQDKYFRGYYFSDPPYTRIAMQLSKEIVPKTALTGKMSGQSLMAFLKKFDLVELYEAFTDPTFVELLGDSDLRVKLDVLSMCGFRSDEICSIAESYNSKFTEDYTNTYLKYFADFSLMDFLGKQAFIARYIEMSYDKDLYSSCLENRSREYIRVALGVNFKAPDPISIVKRVAAINDMQMTRHLTNNNSTELHRTMNLALAIATKLRDVGAGNKSAMEELMDVLSAKYEPSVEKPMTVQELELMFAQCQKEGGE